MEEQFLNHNLSQRLVNLGFDNEQYLNLVFVDKNNNFYSPKDWLPNSAEWTPLIQQARNLLLEKYGKFPVVFSDGFQWTYDLRWADPNTDFNDPYPGVMFPKYGEEDKREYFDTYQQAELKAIEKLIEIVENETSKIN